MTCRLRGAAPRLPGTWDTPRIARQAERLAAGRRWQDHGYVFASQTGTQLDASHVRRSFKAVTRKAGLGENWTPRELRHSFVSLMSDSGVPIETIADLVGHASTAVTEEVYRHQLKPVITKGAETMNTIFTQHKQASKIRVSSGSPFGSPGPVEIDKGLRSDPLKSRLTS
jgi:integrase